MPEELRFDVYQDLPDDLRELAEPMMERIVQLQNEWIGSGRAEAYEEWRTALAAMEELLGPYRDQRGAGLASEG